MLTSFFKPFVVKGAFRFSELFGDKRVYVGVVCFCFDIFFPAKYIYIVGIVVVCLCVVVVPSSRSNKIWTIICTVYL
jgi:hypothetical protein